jgi:hypothetical protein
VLILVQEREELIGSPSAGVSAEGDLSQDAAFLERVERQAHRFGGAADRMVCGGDAKDRVTWQEIDHSCRRRVASGSRSPSPI